MLARILSAQRSLLPAVVVQTRSSPNPNCNPPNIPGAAPAVNPQAGEETLALSLTERLNRLRMVSSPGKREIPNKACKATSARSKLVYANRRAPATTESKNAVNGSTGSMALGEVKR